jgi:hypothetical protein
MKRQFFTELYYFLATFLQTFFLYKIWPTFVGFDVPNFIVYSSTTVPLVAFGQLWCLTFFLTNFVRQIWLRFRVKTTNIILFSTSILILFFSISWHKFIANPQAAFTPDLGLIIYPPLSCLGDDEYNITTKERASIIIWTLEILASIVGATSFLLTVYRPNGTRA